MYFIIKFPRTLNYEMHFSSVVPARLEDLGRDAMQDTYWFQQ